MEKQGKIALKVENHHATYELQNILNVFAPYMGELVGNNLEVVLANKDGDSQNTQETSSEAMYIVESKVGPSSVSATILRGQQVVGECILKVENEAHIRQGLKKTLYTALAQVTGKKAPWGVLTGIRPTKVVHTYKKANYDDLTIAEILIEDYCISREKVSLMMEIAKKEAEILSQNKKDEISLYIGIPFCPTRCLYCSFTSYSLKEKESQVDAYLDALMKEIDHVAKITKKHVIRSLYIGGGTPTSLNDQQLERLLIKLEKSFYIDDIEEYTVEAGRPDTLNGNKLRMMKQYKVGRISINPQTMNPKTLDQIGRSHSVDDIVRIFNMAREEGHDNINMDLIVGLPGEGPDDLDHTMEEIMKLGPDSITVHTMAIKRASRLKEDIDEYDFTKAEEIGKMLAITDRECRKMGMEPYYMYRQKDILGNFENIGYAMPGKESIYNIQMIAEQQTIIAMGAGAVTKMVSEGGHKIKRIPNVKNLEQYIQRIDEMIQRKP